MLLSSCAEKRNQENVNKIVKKIRNDKRDMRRGNFVCKSDMPPADTRSTHMASLLMSTKWNLKRFSSISWAKALESRVDSQFILILNSCWLCVGEPKESKVQQTFSLLWPNDFLNLEESEVKQEERNCKKNKDEKSSTNENSRDFLLFSERYSHSPDMHRCLRLSLRVKLAEVKLRCFGYKIQLVKTQNSRMRARKREKNRMSFQSFCSGKKIAE